MSHHNHDSQHQAADDHQNHDDKTAHGADTKPPTVSPASGKQVSANLVQSHAVFSGFSEPGTDGKSTGELTIHIVRQPNDSRTEAQILFAALQDEFEQAKALR